MRVVVITPPAPLVTWPDADKHLKLDGDETDRDYVQGLIAAATGHIDGPGGWLNRALGEQTLEARFDGFGCVPGRRSWYAKQPPSDNLQTEWGAGPVGTGIVSEHGDPIWGLASISAYDLNSTGATVYLRIVRAADQWPVWGGVDGVPFKFPGPGDTRQITIPFLDAINAGARAQYDLQVRATGGANIRSSFRTMMLEEQVKQRFDEFHLEAAGNAGPGGGSMGGGNINGDFAGDGGLNPATSTQGTGANAGLGGIRGRTVNTNLQ
jgi:hypothetical protein